MELFVLVTSKLFVLRLDIIGVFYYLLHLRMIVHGFSDFSAVFCFAFFRGLSIVSFLLGLPLVRWYFMPRIVAVNRYGVISFTFTKRRRSDGFGIPFFLPLFFVFGLVVIFCLVIL